MCDILFSGNFVEGGMVTDHRKRELIRKIVERLVHEYHPERVILFGSYACGHPTEESDIDLLIIKDTDQSPMERWTEVKRLLRDIAREVPVSPLVYTETEIAARKSIRDFFLDEILEHGEVMYG
jgi:predicted nucleotidyltransferase